MAPRTVSSRLLKPDGTAIVGAVVEVALIADADTGRGTGFLGSSDSEIIWRTHLRTDDEGDWSVSLEPNANITPDGTVYRITSDPPGRAKAETYYIEVPAGSGALWAGDILTDAPEEIESSALAAHKLSVQDHGDWSDTDPASGQVPFWNGSEWVPGDTHATDLEVTSAINTHNADSTAVHGIADTSLLETTAGAASKVAAHEADTTNVHGISNTANLETTAGAQAKVDAHVNDTSAAHASSAISHDGGTVEEALDELGARSGPDARIAQRDAFTARAYPLGNLSWTRTAANYWPVSIGVDGLVYGFANAGSNEPIIRSDDAFATAPEEGATFADIVQWCTRTTDGYVVVTRATDGSESGKIWFSTEFDSGFTVVATTQRIYSTVGIGRPTLGANGHTYLMLGEYSSGALERKMWFSLDGGQTWDDVLTLDIDNGASSVHWHAAAYDRVMDRFWVSAGDGDNAYLGYSDDDGATWTVLEEDGNATYEQPTVLVNLAHGIFGTPDAGGGSAGINKIDPLDGEADNGVFELAGSLTPSSQYGIATYAQSEDGMEAYISIPPQAGGANHFIVATGDGGRSWHRVMNRSADATAWGYGIVGPDLNGKLFMKSSSGTANYEVANLEWERSEAIPQGRPKSATVTYATIPGFIPTSVGTGAISNNTLYYERFLVETEITIDQIIYEVTTAGAASTLAIASIYRADEDWQPLELVKSGTAQPVDAIAVLTETIADTVLRPGRYLKRLHSSGGPTMRILRGFTGSGHLAPGFTGSPFIAMWRKSLAYAAAEDPGTDWDNPSTSATVGEQHMVLLRVKTP